MLTKAIFTGQGCTILRLPIKRHLAKSRNQVEVADNSFLFYCTLSFLGYRLNTTIMIAQSTPAMIMTPIPLPGIQPNFAIAYNPALTYNFI
jgi:hypothetical protein